MELKELKQKYDKLLKDVDFDNLDLGLKNPNIFQILRISKTEIRHSNFLAWLLDPKESHKLGDIFLKRFLREVFSSEKFQDLDQVDVEGMDLSKVEIYREWNNIDLLIKIDEVVVCVENKILSKEHSNQLSKYKLIVENQFPNLKKTFIYLNPEGESSENETDSYQPISYSFIIDSLERIISVYGESLNIQVRYYINDYITIIKRELMGTDKLTELSKKIYTNHKEIFDFIYDHKPDVLDRLSRIMKEEISKRGWELGSESRTYVRFLSSPIKEFIYYNNKSNGWRKKESFLFEIVIYPRTNKFNFKTVISPSDESYDTTRLEEILRSIDGFRAPTGKKWLVNVDKKEKFIYDEIPSMTDEEISNSVNNFYDKITPIIKKVEDKFLQHSEELIKMKSS
jgi:hypothetical protein